MSYFSLRKQAPEPEPAPVEEPAADAPDEQEEPDETTAQTPADAPGNPLIVGLLGPGNWIAARFGTGAAWGVHAVALWACGYYGGWAAAGVVLAWLLAVGLFTPREYLDRIAARIERSTPAASAETAEDPAADTFTDPLPGILWELIGDAPGVHLKTVVTHLHTSGLDTACDRPAVRAALTRRGITVKGSVREADGRVNEGVHRADLQAWEEALSPTVPDAAPEACSSPVATALTCDVAKPATAVATPVLRLRGLLSRGAR